MATLNSTNVQTGNTVESTDILQLYDAFTYPVGTTAYNVSISGSLTGLATSASFAVSASRSVSSSFALTASFAVSASRSVSSSFALTASFATNAVSASYAPYTTFPYTGSAQITGSLGVTGSTFIQGTLNQGSSSLATGLFAHAQGFNVTASGIYSHAEGLNTFSSGSYSHAEGYNTKASGSYSHAEGEFTTATGQSSHAEGSNTTATGSYSHAEGSSTSASGNWSHAEGSSTVASGPRSHAEGSLTFALGDSSHAEGFNTVASGSYQHVQGQYNLSSSAQAAFIVGNGTGTGTSRSNLIFASGSQVQVTGSIIATTGFTGSLLGTASYALNSLNAVTTQWYSPTTNNYSTPSGRDVGILFNYPNNTNPLIHLHTSSAQPGDKVMIIVTGSQTYDVTINVESPAKVIVGTQTGTSVVNGADGSYWKYICVDARPTWRLVEYSDVESIQYGAWTTTVYA